MIKIIDLHCDTVGETLAGANLVDGNPDGNVDLERLRKGNVYAQVFACFISSEVPQNSAFRRTMEMVMQIHRLCSDNPNVLKLAAGPSDLKRSGSFDGVFALIAVENGYAIENDLKNLERLKRQDVCYMTLTHSKHLPWAASSGESAGSVTGLSPFGREVVRLMNELGMIIDVSHVHESTFRDAVKISNKPLIASHSNTRALCDIPRNLSDDQIKAIADNGGMIGVNFFPGFLDQAYAEALKIHCSDLFAEIDKIETAHLDDPVEKSRAMQTFGQELQTRMKEYPVPATRIIDHISHIAEIAGVDHVGFGSDFDGVPSLPSGIGGSDCFPSLLEDMRRRGFSEEDIRKISGENFIRVLEANSV
jgi:membrane dipeptidase